jgi:hypothetical protein
MDDINDPLRLTVSKLRSPKDLDPLLANLARKMTVTDYAIYHII